MKPGDRLRLFLSANRRTYLVAALALVLAATVLPRCALADCGCGKTWPHLICAHAHHVMGHLPAPGDHSNFETGGSWYWMRSPEEERRVVASLYNRYCIRCHGVDGRGVWDIPGVPDFTNPVWQASRPDPYLSRVVIEGRGAVMPAFRGTLTLEESCAMARYLRTFVPGTEVSRPDLSRPAATTPATTAPPAAAPLPPSATTPSPFTR